ncbi:MULTISPECIES: Stp1/IreP family PP2C-type Ser/Thr phosphatase [unclassified Butyrivibrio]|uniref:Stp1/IreP family PP2C-type Ser/Thr phosphatase n=1 Tax=unclassified Butyrivibrio TaxID=2639466 RepID=UPI0003B33124|nr:MULTISPECIES: Stp1/IreP family PP2C-type Ser/Thr phosphatase [unclassified Butyrivibrio]SEL74338.1 protein phosphatase [Butyrivibrio sp. ob235]
MLKTFSITDVGQKRKLNQDYVFSSDRRIGNLSNVFIVADGMGGHNAGDYASKFTVNTMVEEIERSFEQNPVRILENAIKKANQKLRAKAAEDEQLYGMGTTVVAATVMGRYLQVANVGDSRLYVIGDDIRQITRDHSLVQEMVRAGGLDPEEARTHKEKNIITRAIGADDTVDVDFFNVELEKGDIVLMCSDGLTNMLEDQEIRMIVSGQRDIIEKAQKLVDMANQHGGKDNIAVILIEPFADGGAE